MQVRFFNRYRSFRPDNPDGTARFYNLADGQANIYIKRKLAEAVDEQPKRTRRTKLSGSLNESDI